jgi:CheY-like chemotaxis protein
MTQPARILIVDDKEDVRESIQLILEDFGCIFSEAENGGKALELLAAHEFDVVFLDLKLPDQTGIEVLRAARGQRSVLAKIIIVTGSPDPRTLRQRSLEPSDI